MTLRFLGTAYSTTETAIAPSELPVSGTYRGQSISFSSAQPKAINSAVALCYRGVTYLR
jgi:hypothetical protein